MWIRSKIKPHKGLRDIYSLFNCKSQVFAHEETKVFGEKEVLFKCICSKSRCENALMQLDPAELKNMAEDPKGTSMTCQHCGKTYTFTQEELASMYRKISQ